MHSPTIRPYLYQRRFILAHWMTIPQINLITGYWNHTTAAWVDSPGDATSFDTEAGALVYRRGNEERMQQALARAA